MGVFVYCGCIYLQQQQVFSCNIYSHFIQYFATIELFEKMGLIILVAGFLFFYYIAEVTMLTFTETVPSLKGKIPFILTLYFFVMFAVYNLFLSWLNDKKIFDSGNVPYNNFLHYCDFIKHSWNTIFWLLFSFCSARVFPVLCLHCNRHLNVHENLIKQIPLIWWMI